MSENKKKVTKSDEQELERIAALATAIPEEERKKIMYMMQGMALVCTPSRRTG